MRSALFYVVTQHIVVIPYRHFGTPYPFHLQSLRIVFKGQEILISLPLSMLPIGCPETSVRNYRYTLRNKPEERRFQPQVWIEDKHRFVS